MQIDTLCDLCDRMVSFLGPYKSSKFVNDKICPNSFTFINELSIKDPLQLLLREILRDHHSRIGKVRYIF